MFNNNLLLCEVALTESIVGLNVKMKGAETNFIN